MEIIGAVSNTIIDLLNIDYITDKNIYIGPSNISHMQSPHPNDYNKYKNEIKNILDNPDYVGINSKDNSIEYVKEFFVDNEYVKVAVRVSSSNKLYARSLYILNKRRVQNFIAKGTLKKCFNLDKITNLLYNQSVNE